MLYPVELRAHRQLLYRQSFDRRFGRGRGIRTPDILLPKQARYQTALYPDETRSEADSVVAERPEILRSRLCRVK